MRRSLAILACLFLTSCSGNPYGDHPPHPVSGTLLVNGKPADGAEIVLIHLGDWGRYVVPKATTDEEGRFTLSTYGMEDGAPVGEYEVEITWPAFRRGKNVGPDRLGGKFTDHKTSGVKAKIEETTTELPLSLKATVAQAKDPDKQKPASRGKDRRGDRY
jgi:5-hydroxyisourate hydrolase-like protein (transthyretin family)